MGKRIDRLIIIYKTIVFFFFWQFVKNSSALLLFKTYVFDNFNEVDFFQFLFFVSTEILIVLNFCLGVYT